MLPDLGSNVWMRCRPWTASRCSTRCHPGSLLNWLEARKPDDTAGSRKFNRHLAANEGGPQFGILLLDLDADMDKLQATFDSLMDSIPGVQGRGVHHRRIAGGHHAYKTPCISSRSGRPITSTSSIRCAAGRRRDWLCWLRRAMSSPPAVSFGPASNCWPRLRVAVRWRWRDPSSGQRHPESMCSARPSTWTCCKACLR